MIRRFFCIALLLVGACTFPDPQITNDATPGGDSGAPNDSVTTNDTQGGDSFTPIDTNFGEVELDTATNPEVFPDIGPDADPCDLDGDKFQNSTCGETDPSKLDCNDHTPDAHPGVTMFNKHTTGDNDLLWTTLPGDWNCDGTVQYEFKQQACSTGGAGNCVGKLDGYAVDPSTLRCGDPIDFVTCKTTGLAGLSCTTDATSKTNLGCL
jgi:hypothetical protein